MIDKIFVIDRSDTRNLYLKKMLDSDGYMVFDFDESILYPSGHIVYIFAPSKKIDETTARKLRSGSTVFLQSMTGACADDFLLRDITAVKITEDEIFAHKNAELTAEGVLPIIIDNTEKSVKSLKFAVVGLGRVGKCVCKILTDLRLNVTPVATSEQESLISCVFITDEFLRRSDLDLAVKNCDVIINTVPAKVLTADVLKNAPSGALIIDLASNPGGADYPFCEANGINIIHALSLPGKVAPYNAALYLKERIYRALS